MNKKTYDENTQEIIRIAQDVATGEVLDLVNRILHEKIRQCIEFIREEQWKQREQR